MARVSRDDSKVHSSARTFISHKLALNILFKKKIKLPLRHPIIQYHACTRIYILHLQRLIIIKIHKNNAEQTCRRRAAVARVWRWRQLQVALLLAGAYRSLSRGSTMRQARRRRLNQLAVSAAKRSAATRRCVPCPYLPTMRFPRTHDRTTKHVQDRSPRLAFN